MREETAQQATRPKRAELAVVDIDLTDHTHERTTRYKRFLNRATLCFTSNVF